MPDAENPFDERAPQWHVIGAGSIGCLFAAALQQAGIETRLVLRDTRSLAQWRQAGSAIVLECDNTQRSIGTLATIPAELEFSPPLQHMLVCTKAHQTVPALSALATTIDPRAVIVLLQNGMGVRERLQALLPHATILHALSTEGAYQRERFHVVHAGRGETVIGGDTHQHAIAASIAASLRCELRIEPVDAIEHRLWLKLAVNSVINPLTALHGCRNGELLQLPEFEALLPALCAEVCAVANAEGVRLDANDVAGTVRAVCRGTAANRSSMLQDIDARRLTEIDFINGHVVRIGWQHRLPCPTQSQILARIERLQRELGCG